MQVTRYDQTELANGFERTEDGFLRGDAIVTRTGVFIYRNGDGTIRRELRHPDDVFEAQSVETLKLIPVTLNHPEQQVVDSTNYTNLAVGHTGEKIQVDGRWLVARFQITDDETIRTIENNGQRELSLGYRVDLVEESGTFNGEEYDFRQTNIRYNHLAIVDRARAGQEARIQLDRNDAELIRMPSPQPNESRDEFIQRCMADEKAMEDFPEQEQRLAFCQSVYEQFQNDRRDNMANTITLDGIEYQAAPEVINAYKKAQTNLDEAKKTIESKDKEIEQIKADRDSAKEELQNVKEKYSDENLNKMVQDRAELIEKAKSIVNTDGVDLYKCSESEIKKMVINHVFPKANMDSATEAYIDARYDAALELLENKVYKNDAINRQREQVSVQYDGSKSEDMIEAARQRLMDRRMNSNKGRVARANGGDINNRRKNTKHTNNQ